MRHMTSVQPRYDFFVVIVVVIALILRFYKIGVWSFWEDELFTLLGLNDGFNFTVLRESTSHILIRQALRFLPLTESVARTVPALFGVITVPTLYLLLRHIRGPKPALIAAIMLAVAPWHIFWSQNARYPSAQLLFYTVALLLFYIGLEEDRPWLLLSSLLFIVLAAKERLTALFILPVLAVYVSCLALPFFAKPKGLRWQYLIWVGLPVVIVGTFFAGPYIQDLSGWMRGFGGATSTPQRIVTGVVLRIGFSLAVVASVTSFYLLRQRDRFALLLVISGVLPVIIMACLSLFHAASNRYLFVVLTSWIVLAAIGFDRLLTAATARNRLLYFSVIGVLLLEPMLMNVGYYNQFKGYRHDYRAAFDYIQQNRTEDDLVIAFQPRLAYFYGLSDARYPTPITHRYVEKQGKRTWFTGNPMSGRVSPSLRKWIADNTQEVGNFDVYVPGRTMAVEVQLYDPNIDQ
ncbi:MAG: glycosyltransferase family 39 protein [Chloroflexota bacterium]